MTAVRVDERVCPTCGSPMVRAVAKQGPRAGLPLWRCSDFGCRTFINIEDDDVTPVSPAAGESAQAQFERERLAYTDRLRRGAPLIASAGFLAALAVFFSTLIFLEVRFAALGALGIVVVFIWFLFKDLPKEVIYWRQGAESERRVGAALIELEPLGFVVLHDRKAVGRGGNIDSIAVGPAGVYVIETKHRGRGVEVVQGRFEVGGREQTDAIRQVIDLAMLVQITVAQEMNAHHLTVVPVICIGNRGVGGGERAGGVLVLDSKSIAKRLACEPAVLSSDAVQEIARKLDRALPAYERRT